MKLSSNLRTVMISSVLILNASFFSSCKSTEDKVEEPECRPQETEKCPAEDPSDRGYDPCLVNKNLPVCKS